MRDRWYVFKTQPSKDAVAEQNLVNQGFRVFVPRIKVTLRQRNRLVNAVRPLFPGYGFVRFDGSVARWRSINGTRGVAYLISNQEKPSPIAEEFVDELVRNSNGDAVVSPSRGLEAGDQVELVYGPFASQIGTLVTLQPSGRIKVLLSLMSGSLLIETGADSALRMNRGD